MTGVAPTEPLQQRIKDRVLSEASDTAVALFVADVFDGTTVDQAAGMGAARAAARAWVRIDGIGSLTTVLDADFATLEPRVE